MIDAHHHLWRIGRPECVWPTAAEGAIFRDHDVAEYRAVAGRHGVRASILVQSQESIEDTLWLLSIAQAEPMIAGVVGWADLASPDGAAWVSRLALRSKLVGLRPMVQDRPEDWYDAPALDDGIRAMVEQELRLDALVRVPHLASLRRLACRHPDLAIVIDHAAKPRIGAEHGFAEWREAIAPLAERRNVSCKLSGLLTECPPDDRGDALLHPYVAALLELFGPERLMWGSDWPVLDLAGDFPGWLETAMRLVPSSAHAAVFESAARRFYGLAGEAGAA